jgi:hypothetical protein
MPKPEKSSKEGKDGRKPKRKAEDDDPTLQDGEDPEEVKDWRSSEKSSEKKKDEEVPGAIKYKRGEANPVGKLKDRRLKLKLQRINDLAKEAANKAALSEILLPSEPGFLEAEGIEKTQRFSQAQIPEAVDVGSAKKIFSLTLDKKQGIRGMEDTCFWEGGWATSHPATGWTESYPAKFT